MNALKKLFGKGGDPEADSHHATVTPTERKTRSYELKPVPADQQTVIALPASKEKGMIPRVIGGLSPDEFRALKVYVAAKRSAARYEGIVKGLLEEHGKLSCFDAVLSPRVSATYSYEDDLESEIKAVDERKKAARDGGTAIKHEGRMSVSFADKKAKPGKRG